MTNGFQGSVQVELCPNGRDRTLLKPLTFRRGPLEITAPEGFKTDYASTPRILWPLFSPSGRYTPAAIIHDHLYRTGELSRVMADAVFLSAMTCLGVLWFKRYAMYLAVRMFGGSSYKPQV